MDTAKIVRIVALVIALAAAFVDIPQIGLIFAVVGIALGFLAVTEDHRLLFLVIAVALAQVSGAFGAIPAVGEYISNIMGNVSTIVNAAALTVILMVVKDRLTE